MPALNQPLFRSELLCLDSRSHSSTVILYPECLLILKFASGEVLTSLSLHGFKMRLVYHNNALSKKKHTSPLERFILKKVPRLFRPFDGRMVKFHANSGTDLTNSQLDEGTIKFCSF